MDREKTIEDECFWLAATAPARAQPCVLPRPGRRLNLVFPFLSPRLVYAGTDTVLRVFKGLLDKVEFGRIIVTWEGISAFDQAAWPEWQVGTEEFHPRSIAFLRDQKAALPVSDKDYFMLTTWESATYVQSLLHNLVAHEDGTSRRYLYFIQDYEPGFYAMSAEKWFSETAYRDMKHIIALFNTSSLADYFKSLGMRFSKEYVHQPMLHPVLRQEKCTLRDTVKEKLILVYSRPEFLRNAFPLAIGVLREWVRTFPSAGDWRIVSAGESHQDIELGEGLVMKSLGKLSLSEYAQLMSRSWVGVSFMFTPHPGQVAQEMAEFGMWVITNSSGIRDAQRWAPNVIGLSDFRVATVAEALRSCCSKFKARSISAVDGPMELFRGGGAEFEFLDDLATHWFAN